MTLVNTDTGEIVEVSERQARRWAERARLDLEGGADRLEAGREKIRTAITEQHWEAIPEYNGISDYITNEYGGVLAQIGKLLGVEVRRSFVGELTDAGMSTRAIAPVVGVDNATVYRDLKSGVAHATPEPNMTPFGVDRENNTGTFDHGAAFGDHPEPELDTRTTVDLDTGEVIAEGSIPPKVTGIDGKKYTRPTPKPGPITPTNVETAEWVEMIAHIGGKDPADD